MANATINGVFAFTKRGGGNDGCVDKGNSDFFYVTKGREAQDGKWDELEFSGETVKVLFFVFIDVCKQGMFGGGDTLDGKKIIEH